MATKPHKKTDNWRVSGAGRPEWTFFADAEDQAESLARTFTRWDLEHAGKTGEFTIELTNLKSGAVRELRGVAGKKEARPQRDAVSAVAA